MRTAVLAWFALACVASLVACPPVSLASDDREAQKALPPSPCDFVDPFIGTGGDGHCYPGAVVPFGMVQLSPDTAIPPYPDSYPWCAGYRWEDPTILGFSHTHFSGTGHSDLGDILLMPTTGELRLGSGTEADPDSGYRSRFSHDAEEAEPGYYSVLLKDYDIRAELTATRRVGVHRYTFLRGGESHVLLDLLHTIYPYEGKVIWSWLRVDGDRRISGFRQTRGWARTRTLYFAIEFSRPFAGYGFWCGDDTTYGWKQTDAVVTGRPEICGRKLKAFARFDTKENEALVVKVGISAVSPDGALRNLQAEVPDFDFDRVRAEARRAWERELSRVSVEGSERDKRIFLTALYHLFLAPSTYMDVDGRYRGLDQNIHVAEGFENMTVFSLWDTFRAAHPFFTLVQRERVPDMVRSMLAHFEESPYRMLPVWSFHANETWCMIGYHAVSVIADACVKGIRGFDTAQAFEAVLATARRRTYDGLDHYIDHGYVAIDREDEAASKTLEYAYDDWSIARMAEVLGRTAERDEFLARAANYRNVFDAETGFVRARRSDGSWNEPFDPLYSQYGGDYTEGNAWQYSWFVPQDVEGLIRLMGGRDRVVEKLDTLFELQVHDEKYHQVEDISGLLGQYAHGNEPSHHVAYLYTYAGRPWRTEERLHEIVSKLYGDTPGGLCGNEDCGQMSAWYLFTAIGFYPVCPGDGVYVLGRPFFPRVSLQVGDGVTCTVTAEGLSDENLYVQEVYWEAPRETLDRARRDRPRGGSSLRDGSPARDGPADPGQRPSSLDDFPRRRGALARFMNDPGRAAANGDRLVRDRGRRGSSDRRGRPRNPSLSHARRRVPRRRAFRVGRGPATGSSTPRRSDAVRDRA